MAIVLVWAAEPVGNEVLYNKEKFRPYIRKYGQCPMGPETLLVGPSGKPSEPSGRASDPSGKPLDSFLQCLPCSER